MRSVWLLPIAFISLTMLACHNPHAKKRATSTSNVSLMSDGVRIDYTDTGKGDTTLLLVHGWCINKTYWANQVAYFGKNYRVVTIDLPGFGKSAKNRTKWNTATYGQDIKNVINQLALKNVILVGHSMAGNIILQGAIDAPENVLALVGVDNFKSTGIPLTDSLKAIKEYNKAIAAMRKNFRQVAFDWFNQDLFYKTTSKTIRDRVLNDVAHSDSLVAIATQELDNFNDASTLLKVKKKLYLINSDYKSTDTSGLTAKKITFELLIIHDTGHFPMIEKPKEFNALLDKAIADIRKQ